MLLQSLHLASRIADESAEALRQFSNSFRLLEAKGILWNQVSADAQRRSACRDEPVSGLLVDAACRDQWNMRQGLLDNPDVAVAAD